MNKRVAVIASLISASALVLAGCAQPQEENLGDIETLGDTNVVDAIAEELENLDNSIADSKALFFEAGYYAFTYKEDVLDSDILETVNAEGYISFRENGTCAFDTRGTKTRVDGSNVEFTFIKSFNDTASLRFADESFNRMSPTEYEADLSLKLPVLGPFPRTADYAGFCGVQAMVLVVDRAERAPGTGVWNTEKGDAFVAQQLDLYYKNMFNKLGLEKVSESEARTVLEETYFGSDVMPIWDPVVEFQTDPNSGVVTIKSGVPGESNYAEMILEPLSAGSSERQLQYVQEYEVSWDDHLQFLIETYGSGDKFIESRSEELPPLPTQN